MATRHAAWRSTPAAPSPRNFPTSSPTTSSNRIFNTWGNLAVNARAGLLFLDFEKGDVLPLAVTADILWEDAEVAHFAGARRLLRLSVREMRRIAASLPLRWGPVALSTRAGSDRPLVVRVAARWETGAAAGAQPACLR